MRAMRRGLIVVAASFVIIAPDATAATPASLPPANAPPVEIAAQFLGQISESKSKPMVVACVSIPDDLTPGIVFVGAAIVRGNVMLLSSRYVCQPLADIWRSAPVFTGHAQLTIPFSAVDAIEIIENEWFHTQGVVSGANSMCRAVEYTWKWLRRSDLSPAFLAAAQQHLLDNGLRPAGYAIPADCLTSG